MKTKTEYGIVSGSPDWVMMRTNELLEDGWKLYGHPSMGYADHAIRVVQALTKEVRLERTPD